MKENREQLYLLKNCQGTHYYKLLRMKTAILFLGAFIMGCVTQSGNHRNHSATLVFKHGKPAGDPAEFNKLLQRFEEENPGVFVRDEILPASTDEQHQFYVINLEGKSSDFDVMSLDVIWVPEFTRAGWLRDLSALLTPEDRKDYFPGPMQAVTSEGRIYAIPWYIDAGLLYYRKDLLQKYGFTPPKTWPELIQTAQWVAAREPGIYGFIWQGKQYEGLVCNVLEYCWSNGGDVLKNGQTVISSENNIHALGFMRNLIVKYKVTPPLVMTATEEQTRHIFGNGKALFMRNWTYAWNIFEKEGSPVKGKVGMTLLPAFSSGESASTLGGWQLGVNRYSKHAGEAEKLVQFLARPDSQKSLALIIGYKPARKSIYTDGELKKNQPFITGLSEVFIRARPRPVSPYYMMISQVMQPEFSAVLSGIKTPEAALSTAQKQIEYILKMEK